jgi:hypothetical protein
VLLLKTWIFTTTVGETLGFAVAAAIGGLLATTSAGTATVYITMVCAGAIEGALLGAGQALALRRSGAGIPTAPWILRTSLAAAVAWSIGMLPSTLAPLDWNDPVVMAVLVVGALVLLSSIPLAQVGLLRRAARPAWPWVPLNLAAWALGISWTMLPSPFVDASTPPALIFAVYCLTGLMMALTVALVTGLGLKTVVLLAIESGSTLEVGYP